MALPSSYKAAGLIGTAVIVYFVAGTLFKGFRTETVEEAPAEELFAVVIKEVAPARHGAELIMRGRTEAQRKVDVRAETPGQVTLTPAEEGSFVTQGDLLCEISLDSRNANLAQARAAVRKAQIDYDAARKLAEQGFQSDAAVATARAALDASQAGLNQARLDIGKTKIKAPFSGMLDSYHVEVGDLLSVGAPCATVAELDPLQIKGAVSEREVGRIKRGDKAQVTLSTGEAFEAAVTSIAAASNNATRTFSVDLSTKNPGAVKDGITANATIFVGDTGGYLVPRNSLVISDEGVTGLRIAEKKGDADIVKFISVRIMNDEASGVWVAPMDDAMDTGTIRLITRGQDYVLPGQEVIAMTAEEVAAQQAKKEAETANQEKSEG